MPRKLLRLAGFAGGAVAGAVLYRRWSGERRERIDVYFEDGSFVTFGPDSAEAERLLPIARQVVAAARPA